MKGRRAAKRIAENKYAILAALLAGIFSLSGLTGCASSTNSGSVNTGVAIDWVNFVRFGGITYLAVATKPGRPLAVSDLGPVFATVQFELEGNINDPHYQSKDGDAAFLDAGTRVYTVKGYSPTFRLAARDNNTLRLYEADTNSHARKGSDLLDIGGKVRTIGIASGQDGVTEVGAIKDPQQVTSLVNMILSAPVDQNSPTGNQLYFLVFHLRDGTTTSRAYWLDANKLQRGIVLPDTFAVAVKAALAGH